MFISPVLEYRGLPECIFFFLWFGIPTLVAHRMNTVERGIRKIIIERGRCTKEFILLIEESKWRMFWQFGKTEWTEEEVLS